MYKLTHARCSSGASPGDIWSFCRITDSRVSLTLWRRTKLVWNTVLFPTRSHSGQEGTPAAPCLPHQVQIHRTSLGSPPAYPSPLSPSAPTPSCGAEPHNPPAGGQTRRWFWVWHQRCQSGNQGAPVPVRCPHRCSHQHPPTAEGSSSSRPTGSAAAGAGFQPRRGKGRGLKWATKKTGAPGRVRTGHRKPKLSHRNFWKK